MILAHIPFSTGNGLMTSTMSSNVQLFFKTAVYSFHLFHVFCFRVNAKEFHANHFDTQCNSFDVLQTVHSKCMVQNIYWSGVSIEIIQNIPGFEWYFTKFSK